MQPCDAISSMPDHNYFSNLIWQIVDLLRGPYRSPQYERVMLPMTVLRRFDCVLAPTKARVLAERAKRKGGKLEGDALDMALNKTAGQRYTVKRYESEKEKHGDSWRHTRVTLKPLNPDFEPIVLSDADEQQVQVVAELIEVLAT